MRCAFLPCLSLVFCVLACGTTAAQSAPADAAAADVANDATADVDAPDAATVAVERGPKAIALDADPNGLVWADDLQTLFIADDNNNRILTWTDAAGFGQAFALPAAPSSGAGLGGMARLADGTLVVARFGFGTDGGILFVKPDGSTGKVPNLDVTRRRLGIAVDSAGTLYDSFFTKNSSGAQVGTIATFDLTGSEVQVASAGLAKPVGVAIVAGALYIDDQANGKLWRCTPPDCTTLQHIADIATPDLMTPGPAGSLFVGSHAGTVLRVQPDGTSAVLSGGFQEPHGVAYDAGHARVFVSDHDPSGAHHFLQIVPVN